MDGTAAREDRVARAALALFGLADDAELEFVKFRENRVYRVGTPAGAYALRMHRPGYRSDQHLRDEVRTLGRLAARGAAVPQPIPAVDGEYVAVVDDEDGTRRQATVLTWVEHGSVVGDSGAVFAGVETPDTALLERLGCLIGALHLTMREIDTPTDYCRPAWDAAGLSGTSALWGTAHRLRGLEAHARDTLIAADRAVGEALSALPKDRDHYGVIHADMTFENVLQRGGDLVALDFDDSGEGWYAFDLATPSFWMSAHPDAGRLVEALVTGYEAETGGEMPISGPGWHALLLARGLSYLGWAADRPDDPTSAYHLEVLAPWVIDASRRFLDTGETGWPSPVHSSTRK